MEIKALFRKKKQTAAVFVDFEHWSYSLNRLYGLKPRIEDFGEELTKQYDVKRIFFFGDFSEGRLSSSVEEIRRITNNIIETKNPSVHPSKDFTDFILLDYIYRDVDEYPKTDVYILFSGDGHFSSVAAYLKNKKKKKVVVYGIRKAISNALRSVSDECIELPTSDQEFERYFKMLLSNMDYLDRQNRIMYPTFRTTVQNVARRNNVEERYITAALEELIHKEIIRQEIVNGGFQKQIKILKTNWDAAERDGYWIKNHKSE